MPALSNGRHELFAQLLATGKTGDAAYEEAGYKFNRGNAARLKADEAVQARVEELQQAAALKTGVTIAALNAELVSVLQAAKISSLPASLNVRRQTVMDIAKLNGLVVDRHGGASGEAIPVEIRWATSPDEAARDPSEVNPDPEASDAS